MTFQCGKLALTTSPILYIFGTYHESGTLMPYAIYQHSMANGQQFRGHYKFGISLSLKTTFKIALISIFINLKKHLIDLFIQN